MIVDRIVICDFCYDACLPDDLTIVHLEESGQPFEVTFHNTPEKPCLRSKIEELWIKFSILVASD